MDNTIEGVVASKIEGLNIIRQFKLELVTC